MFLYFIPNNPGIIWLQFQLTNITKWFLLFLQEWTGHCESIKLHSPTRNIFLSGAVRKPSEFCKECSTTWCIVNVYSIQSFALVTLLCILCAHCKGLLVRSTLPPVFWQVCFHTTWNTMQHLHLNYLLTLEYRVPTWPASCKKVVHKAYDYTTHPIAACTCSLTVKNILFYNHVTE